MNDLVGEDLPGLDRLDQRQRRRVAEAGQEVGVPAHWSLILEDSPADSAYLLLAGEVEVRSHGDLVASLGPGDFIGELGLVARRLRTATVTTLEPVRALAFQRHDFTALRSELPAFDEVVTGLARSRQEENSARRTIDTVALDVDGTLVDSVYQHVRAWQVAFDEVGLEVPGARLHRAIGMGGDRLVTEVAGSAAEAAHGDRVRERHDAEFSAVLRDVHALPGAVELLRELRARGLKVAVASSGNPEQTAHLLDLVGADSIDHDRATAADVDRSKPAPDVVDEAVQRVGGTNALVVGDAVWDVESANAQQRPSIALLSGGFSEHELRSAGAGWVYDDPADLLDQLDETPLGR